MYHYVFFDLDGTLTQSEFGIVEAAGRALAHFGIETPNRDLLKRFIGPPLYVSFHEFYGLSDEDSFEAIRVYREYYESEGVYLAPLFAGVKDTLQALRDAGCRLMIVTSKPQNMAEVVAKHEGVRDFFEGIIGPSLEGRDPNKAVFIRTAMEQLGLTDADRGEILMVGDRFYDIKAACEVGIDSVGVLYGYGNEEELRESGATFIVKTPAEIAGVALGDTGSV
jgi:Predicted phosphatases